MSTTLGPKVAGHTTEAREIAERGTILRAVVGSTVHGTAIEGTDDRDEMGVCIEPEEYVIGLRRFEQYTYRDQPVGVRSQPGDLDLTVYSLRKYCHLAAGGNPSILLLLFAPPESIVTMTKAGERLVEARDMFRSRRAGNAFLGYMRQQRQRLMGERGQKRVRRPELVERYGYDTKYAGHLIRLGLQGREYLRTGHISLPMVQADRELVLAVRQGEVSLGAVLDLALKLYDDLADLIRGGSPLPDEPDRALIDRFLIDEYEAAWEG